MKRLRRLLQRIRKGSIAKADLERGTRERMREGERETLPCEKERHGRLAAALLRWSGGSGYETT
uniref:Uncharacterized protein n=1 Tax=Nymphaea colorata TaxID=210225 RepID=A0A5K1FNV7_9MAGN